MMHALRIAVTAAGALALLLGGLWVLDPDRLAPAFGLAAEGALGRASLRADLGAFFSMTGLLCIAAGLRNEARLMTGPLLLILIALLARIISLLADGAGPGVYPPIAVEAGLLALFALARFRLGAGPLSSR